MSDFATMSDAELESEIQRLEYEQQAAQQRAEDIANGRVKPADDVKAMSDEALTRMAETGEAPKDDTGRPFSPSEYEGLGILDKVDLQNGTAPAELRARIAKRQSGSATKPAGSDIAPIVDAAYALPSSLGKGAVATLGMPGDLTNLGYYGLGRLKDAGEDYLYRPLAGMPARSAEEVQAGRDARTAPFLGSEDYVGAYEDASGTEFYEPQTWLGRMTDSVGSSVAPAMAGSGLGPLTASLGRGARATAARGAPSVTPRMRVAHDTAKFGMLPAAAGEAAVSGMDEDSAYRPLLKGLTAALTGGVAAATEMPGRAQRLLVSKTRGYSDDTLRDADKLMWDASQQNVGVTGAEALDRASGHLGMGQFLSNIGDTEKGNAILTPWYAKRARNVAAAAEDAIDRFGPAGRAPSLASDDLANVAEDAIKALRDEAQKKVGPLYTEVNKTKLSRKTVGELNKLPGFKAARSSRDNNPVLGPKTREANKANTLGRQNDYRRRMGTLIEQNAPTVSAAGDRELMSAITADKRAATDILYKADPRLKAADDLHSAELERLVRPAENSPLGALARTTRRGDGIPTSPEEVYSVLAPGRQIRTGSGARDDEIAGALTTLAKGTKNRPKEAVAEDLRVLARDQLKAEYDTVFGRTAPKLQHVENKPGAFVANVRNDSTGKALNDAFYRAGSAPAADNLNGLLDAMYTTTARLRSGSNSGGKVGSQDELVSTLARAPRLLRGLGSNVVDAIESRSMSNQGGKLAEILTSPDAITKIKLAREQGTGRARAFYRTLLATLAAQAGDADQAAPRE